jgi:hypothetical protein
MPVMAITRDDCPRCGKVGMVGSEREFVGEQAVTVFKCHHCNFMWRVPDAPTADRRGADDPSTSKPRQEPQR